MLCLCFAAVLLSVNTFQFAVSLRIYVLTSPYTQCSGDQDATACLTLKQVITSEITRSSTQLVLELQPGVHILESGLNIHSIESVDIYSTQATVLCTQTSNSFFHDLQFRYIQIVNISGVRFVNCMSVFMYTVPSVRISECFFHGLSKSRAVGLELSSANATISSSTFIGKQYGLKLISSAATIFSCHFLDNDIGVQHTASSTNMSTYSCTFVGNNRGIHLFQSSAKIFGCVFKRNENESSAGSAVFADRINTLLLSQSTFISNIAYDGVIYVSNPYTYRLSSTAIERCRFIDNTSRGHGGVLYLNFNDDSRYPAKCTINKSVFINNRATVSGGVISAVGNLSIIDSIFGYNSAPQCGVLSARSSWVQFSTTLVSNTFLLNRAVNYSTNATSSRFEFGGVACFRNAAVSISNGTFSHNMAAGDGGVISARGSNIVIESSLFHNNTAGIDGGVLYTRTFPSSYTMTESNFNADASNITTENSLFHNNSAGIDGSYTRILPSGFTMTGSSFTNNRAGYDGGVLYSEGNSISIDSSTFNNNSAGERGGAIIAFRGTLGIRTTNMINNIANRGNDIAICSSPIISTPTYLNLFLTQTHSIDLLCQFYATYAEFSEVPAPEDRSNLDIDHYLHLPAAVSSISFAVYTSVASAEKQPLKELEKKLFEISVVSYIFFSFILVLIMALIIIFGVVKICSRSARKYQNNNSKTSATNDYNNNIEIYNEPTWNNSQPSNAIKLEPNVVYR